MGCKSSSDKPNSKPKAKHRKGLWSPEEDQRLRNHVILHGHACWSSVPINAGLQRNGKSCRLRWINYLRPGLKRGMFNLQEEETILTLHRLIGNKWSQIAQHLPGRTDNEIKNFWHSHLKKKLAKLEETEDAHGKTQCTTPSSEILETSSPSPNNNPSTRSSSYESLPLMEKSSAETDHKSRLPKLFFAEWLSLDQANNNGNRFASSCEKVASRDGFNNNNNDNDQNLNFVQDSSASYVNGSFWNEGGFGSDFIHNGFNNNNSLVDEMMSSRLKFEDHHHQFSGIGFVDSISGYDVCSDLNVDSDVMYI